MAKKQITKKTMNGIDATFRLRNIVPKTPGQEYVFESWEEGFNVLMHGVAGTGKTFIAIYLALRTLLKSKCDPYNKVVIIRSCVQSREMGHLPGDAKEKMAEYEAAYKYILSDLFERGDALDVMKTKGYIEFISTSFLRGKTFENCLVIVDEIQNMNFQELDTIITRTGNNCRLFFCGDYAQTDLIKHHEKEGLLKFLDILFEMKDDFEYIEFGVEDIVRSKLVKNYIEMKYKLESNKKV
jgi:phosphate starvation-inducible PhoH-like protein